MQIIYCLDTDLLIFSLPFPFDIFREKRDPQEMRDQPAFLEDRLVQFQYLWPSFC